MIQTRLYCEIKYGVKQSVDFIIYHFYREATINYILSV